MNILQNFRKKISNFGNNIKLTRQAKDLLKRNKGYLKTGDSIPTLKLKKLINQSTMRKRKKEYYTSELDYLFTRHLIAGENWLNFKEMLANREKTENVRFSEEEKKEMWKRWNKNQRSY